MDSDCFKDSAEARSTANPTSAGEAAVRRFGALRDVVSIGSEFEKPLPEEELAAWE